MNWLAQNFHPHLIFYTFLLLFLIYRPPAVLLKFQGISDFIRQQWGDSIGLYLLHLGVLLFILGGFYPPIKDIQHLGESFILTAVGILKLRQPPEPPEPPKP